MSVLTSHSSCSGVSTMRSNNRANSCFTWPCSSSTGKYFNICSRIAADADCDLVSAILCFLVQPTSEKIRCTARTLVHALDRFEILQHSIHTSALPRSRTQMIYRHGNKPRLGLPRVRQDVRARRLALLDRHAAPFRSCERDIARREFLTGGQEHADVILESRVATWDKSQPWRL